MASDTPSAETTTDAGDAVAAAARDMLEQWLSLSRAFASGTFGALGRAPDGGASDSVRRTVAETIGRVATGINLPNRADILEIGAQVATLDARLARIEALLTRLADRPGSVDGVPRPRRTRRPP